MSMMLRQLFDRESCTYTYLIADQNSEEALLIDPVVEHVDLYLNLIKELSLTLKYAVDTHTHADHISALGELRDRVGCQTRLGKQSLSTCVDVFFDDGDFVEMGNVRVTAIYTPGHTDDSYSFVVKETEQYYLFTGDTLLIRGTGRTDFQNGDALDQYESLTKKLLSYPDSAIVLPGHDYKGFTRSTIAEERSHNPRLQVKNGAEYKTLMDQLNLPTPKMMDVAVPQNRACGKA